MANKQSDKSSEPRRAPAIQTATSGTVNIFNTGTTQVAKGIRVHGGSKGDRGPQIRAVKFLPGNNKIDAADWAECKKSNVVQSWLSAVDRFDMNGNIVKGRTLIEDYVDDRYKSKSTDLATRMAAAQAVKRAMSAS